MAKKGELTSRQIQAAQMKRKILDTTIALYQARDYDSVTIADICNAAEISTGNFYHYFKSKDDVLNEGFIKLNNYFEEISDNLSLPPLERIEFILSVYFDSIVRNGYRFMSIFLHNEVLQQITYENTPLRSTFVMLKEALEEAFASNVLANGDPTVLFYDTYRLLKGVTFDWVVRHGEFSLKDEFFRMYRHLISPYLPTK